MEIIVELLLELLIEVLFAAVVGLFDSGLEPKLERGALRVVGLVLAGIGLGAASTLVLPDLFLQARAARLLWLALAPVLGGSLIGGVATLRSGRSWRWDRFIGGAAFIGCLNATRFAMLG